jgi:DNA replication and repair protein RecF
VRLLWIELRDFRNHAETRLQAIPDGLIVVAGPNGVGKTNLLEAMFFLAGLASSRTSAGQPMVRYGAEAAYVRGEFETLQGRILVEVEIPPRGASRVHVDRSPLRRKRELRSRVRSVFFGPDDLMIVIGDPSRRRGFLDEAVRGIWPAKESAINSYDRAVRQRNRLLKEWDGRGEPPGLGAWDDQLVEAGSALVQARRDAVEALRPQATEEFGSIAGYPLGCSYLGNVDPDPAEELPSAFRRRLRERHSDELQRRTSLVGPHRDDLLVEVRELGARGFASHGEAWAAALSLRLGLAGAVDKERGEPPVLLVDDPLSALDPERRTRVIDRLLSRAGQIVISVADEADVPAAATEVWKVKDGSVEGG